MAKFIIIWDMGYGKNTEVIEAEDLQMASDAAYEAAREDFESHADYSAIPWTKEIAAEMGLEDDE